MSEKEKTFRMIDAFYARCFKERAKDYVEYLKEKGRIQELLDTYKHDSEEQHLQYVELIAALIQNGHYEKLTPSGKTAITLAEELGLGSEVIDELEPGDLLSPYTMNDDAFFHSELDDLHDLVQKGRYLEVGGRDKFKTASIAVDTYCHQVSAFLWAAEPLRYEIWTGITDATHCHSWLRDKSTGEWLEPTTIERDTYFGYKVRDPVKFLEIEFKAILSMFREGLLNEEHRDQFLANYNRLTK